MAIIYRGRLEGLAKEVEEAKEAIDRRYVEILGEARAQKLKETAERVLGPESFFDDVEELNKRLRCDLPADTSNKMTLVTPTPLNLKADGSIKNTKVRTAAAFYISEKGFEHSSSSEFTERLIASYVHEYDHFVWYALQERPLYLFNMFFSQAIQADTHDMNLAEYAEKIEDEPIPPEEKIKIFSLAVYSTVLTEQYEKANRVLDKMVLESIGIDVPLEWRGKPRRKPIIPMPTTRTLVAIGTGGDPFGNLKDEEIIENVMDWENCLKSYSRTKYQHNLTESLKRIKVSRVYIKEIFQSFNKKH